MENKNQKYLLEVDREQLTLIARCVEDCSRFAAGQVGMDNTLWTIGDFSTNINEARELLRTIKPYITPGLHPDESYGWSGAGCDNVSQRKFIARTYGLYREILHFLAVEDDNNQWNVYRSETLTCEDGGELPKISKCQTVGGHQKLVNIKNK